MIKIREYTPSDLLEIARLFYDTVHTVNAADYSDEQLDAWADGNIGMDKWNKSLESHYSLVAEEDGIIAGFGDIDETGYLDRLYVHKDYQGRRIGTAICERLESRARGKITTHASVTAKPFFLQREYKVIREQQVERRGVLLTNFVMEKDSYKTKIRITEAENRDAGLTEKLVDVWEGSVRATHHFLSDDEILKIKEYVPEAIKEVPVLLLAKDADGNTAGFLGIADNRIEMLFVSAEYRGQGIGSKLLSRGIAEYGANELAVNEQNPLAKGFYEHMGFEVFRRTDFDEQGNPYPLLYMKYVR